MDKQIKAKIQEWLDGPYDEETKKAIRTQLEQDPISLENVFARNLTFGTGGIRGIMGVGTNRLNIYTIRSATKGLANYLSDQPTDNVKHSVVIGYDSRFNSQTFAKEAARVLAASNIKVYLTPALRPTPFVSYACRYKQASAAIMITASHNPSEYNGFKVYWNDGAQVIPPHDQGIIDAVNKIQHPAAIKITALQHPLITYLTLEDDNAYLEEVTALQNTPEDNKKLGPDLHIIYSNLNGTGITLLPKALANWGFTHLSYVEAQKEPNGHFPSVTSPNPENKDTLYLGIKDLTTKKADLFIITDPDADRIGIVVMHKSQSHILSGNQIAAIFLFYIAETLTMNHTMPDNGAFVTTIVTSTLLSKIAKSYGKPCFEVLTGFKYIGEKIRQWKTVEKGYQFLFGAEESHGYLIGTHARDKDAIISACLIAEITSQLKKQGKTLVDYMHTIYNIYGIHREKQLSITLTPSNMASLMENLRNNPPKEILGEQITHMEDYLTHLKTNLITNKQERLTLPKSDVLVYLLADESKLVIRPSGTEPKIKIYAMAVQKTYPSMTEGIQTCDAKLDNLLSSMKENHLKI